ncbi:MAG: four helix bundle suffix domain-containing protein [Alistipes sp.]|nr:four helix bundle suffix domain-containing protein [Alistipes sp.]
MNTLHSNTGSYRNLKAYRKAEVIYDLTYYFCEKYLKRGDRTIDQMVQAARSGKQNIVEGNAVSATSIETFLKLLGVARGSLQELLKDYEDYLRVRNLRLWESDSKEVEAMRKLGKEHEDSAFFLSLAQSRSDEVIANMTIVLIYQADALLNGYIQMHYNKFLQEGGFREKLTRERLSCRNNK